MRLSAWIQIYQQILEKEGDIEVEGPDGYLLKKAQIITRNQKTIEDLKRRDDFPQPPAGGKAK